MRDAQPILHHLIVRNLLATGYDANYCQYEARQIADFARLQLRWVEKVLCHMSETQEYYVQLVENGKQALLPVERQERFIAHFAETLRDQIELLVLVQHKHVVFVRIFTAAFLSAWIKASTGKIALVFNSENPDEGEYVRFLQAGALLEKISASALNEMPICKQAKLSAQNSAKLEIVKFYDHYRNLPNDSRAAKAQLGRFINLLIYMSRVKPSGLKVEWSEKFHKRAEIWLVELGLYSDDISARSFLQEIGISDPFLARANGWTRRLPTKNAEDQAIDRGRKIYHQILCRVLRDYAIPPGSLMETKSKKTLADLDLLPIDIKKSTFDSNFGAGNAALGLSNLISRRPE